MMVLRRDEQKIEHARFVDLKEFLRDADLFVLNDSRVLSARHFSDDGKLEFLFLEKIAVRRWKALVKPGRRFGRKVVVSIQGVQAEAGEIFADGSREVILAEDLDLLHSGAMPLPPYIKRSAATSGEANRAGGLCQYRLVAGATSAPDRAAPAMKQAQLHVVTAEHRNQRDLRLVELPPGSQKTAILVAVRIAEHDFLHPAPIVEQTHVFPQAEKLVHDLAAMTQIADRLEQRDDIEVQRSLARPQ